MNDYSKSGRQGRRIGVTILILLCAGLVVLAADEVLSVDMARRRAQNAADAAAFAGVWRLASVINGADDAQDLERLHSDSSLVEAEIKAEMMDFAARNGLVEADELVAYYLTVGSNRGDVVGSGLPSEVCGVEVLVTTRTNSFLTRTLGLAGWRIERGTAFCLEVANLEGEDTPTMVWPTMVVGPHL